MSTPPDHFLDLAVRPFADNAELQVHARRMLGENANPDAPPDSWQAATTTLQHHDRTHRFRYRDLVLLVLAVITVVACLWKPLSNLGTSRDKFNYAVGRSMAFYDPSDRNEEHFRRSLNPEKRLILCGDLTRNLRSDRLESLCARYPDNPSYYADYALAYWTDHTALPPDFLATAAHIDPDNGWFLFFAAGTLSRELTEHAPLTRKQVRDHVPNTSSVSDEPRFQQAMMLFHQAASMPRFESYQQVRLREMLDLLPPPTDTESAGRCLALIVARPSPAVPFRHLLDTICAAAERTGDPEALKTLTRDWEIMTHRLLRSGSTLIDILIAEVWAAGPIRNLKASATRLGVEQDYTHLSDVLDVLFKNADDRRNRSSDAVDDLVTSHGGLMYQLTIEEIHKQVYHPPGFDPTWLEPGRRTDHALVGQADSVAACFGLVIACGLCAVHRFRHGLLLRRVSARLENLLTMTDWLWLAAAVIAPQLYQQALWYLTPLGGRDWSLSQTEMRVPLLQAVGGFALMLTTPIVIATWRLSKRTRMLDFAKPRNIMDRSAWIAAAVSIPLAGLCYVFPGTWDSGWIFIALCCLLVQIWWLIAALSALFGGQARAPGRLLVGRMLVPAYLLGILATALMIPGYEAQERYWVSKDTLQPGYSSDVFGMSRFEEMVIRQKRIELSEMLAPLQEKP